ncbi:B-cell receptor CD22-like [Centropristis striata]|uniref:B-cell receptor CD22-like n=1 Tax=Centropristis striata TaxID=184440 RepID=UPI0027E1A20A|nr:B-cell receptor CD22-like [Centropristis striata]
MVSVLTLLGCLLQGAHCGVFVLSIPRTIEVLSGSCVTIPCSFDIEEEYKPHLDRSCRVLWKQLNEDECFFSDWLICTFLPAAPPTPTLTASTLKVKEGTSVGLTCSAPAPCLSHPPALTWTPGLGDAQEKLQENQDKTKVKLSVLTFTASHLHHGKKIYCKATYNKQDGSTESAVSTSLTADISCALCRTFQLFVPPTIEVLSGSCVTIPCSFDIERKYDSFLDRSCRILWKQTDDKTVFDSGDPQTSTIKGELTGDVTKKDCTTTLNNMQPAHSKLYIFRLECNNGLRISFKDIKIDIKVKAAPPTPTLTASTLKVKEGTSVGLTCSAPAPCLSHPPALTWTPGLGDAQEKLQENQDKTKVKLSVLTFTASHLHHGKKIDCKATYNKQDGSTESAVSTSLTADISCQETFLRSGPVLTINAANDNRFFFCKTENDIGAGQSNKITINVQYSPKNTTVSVSPSGPVPEGRNVTLTCNSSANPPVGNYTWYRADGGQETLIGTRQVVNIKVSKGDNLFFCKAENEIGTGRSNISQIDVQFAPQILPSSNCTNAASQLNCSCRTVGNPSPTLKWYLDGLPVNQSDTFGISSLNDTGLRSILIVNQPQERDLSNLLCLSSNSLGSASQRFCVASLKSQDHVSGHELLLPVFITTVAALLVLVCALLFVIRAQRTQHNLAKNQCTGDTSTLPMTQLLTSGEENEVPNTTQEDIYVNTNELRQAEADQHAAVPEPNSTDLPSSGPNNAEETNKSSEKKGEEGSDMIYSSVIWKSKSKVKGEDSVNMNRPGSSYLEEESYAVGGMCKSFMSTALEMGNIYDKVEPRNVEMAEESAYAQVKFKDKSPNHQ